MLLTPEGKLKEGILEALGEENKTSIAKVAWLSRKDTGKAYGSMIIYFSKRMEAIRFLTEKYIYVGGESATVWHFEPKTGPSRCYQCHEMGHKAFHCKNPVKCGKCTGGHTISECKAEIPKCAVCGGPHAVMSFTCPSRHGFQALKNLSTKCEETASGHE